ncbi:MAG: hypothetical protein AAB635_00710 [Patescibacteria group bacterium]
MKNGHINNLTATLMISVAIFYDLIQALFDLLHLIPVIGNVIATVITALLSVVAWLTFYVWFKMHGVHFNSAKRAITMGAGFLIELMPILNILPAWTLAVVLIFLTARMPKIVQVATGAAGAGKGSTGGGVKGTASSETNKVPTDSATETATE